MKPIPDREVIILTTRNKLPTTMKQSHTKSSAQSNRFPPQALPSTPTGPSLPAILHCLNNLTSSPLKAPTTLCNTPRLLKSTKSPSSQSCAYTYCGLIAGLCNSCTRSRTSARSEITEPLARWMAFIAEGWIWRAIAPVTGLVQTMGRIWILEGSMGGREESSSSRPSEMRPRPSERDLAPLIQI